MNPDPDITYLTGAGFVHDICEWIAIAWLMMACAVTLGILLGVWRKKRIARNAVRVQQREWELNWFAGIKPGDPRFSVPVVSDATVTVPWRHWAIQPTPTIRPVAPVLSNDLVSAALSATIQQAHKKLDSYWESQQPIAPACGVAQSCNGCNDCPDLHRAPIESLDV